LENLIYVGSPDGLFWNYSILDCNFSKYYLHRITTHYLTCMLFGTLKAGNHVLDLGIDEEKTL
jgi:hypothetical protein